jgi:hypothetical protein
MDKITFDMQKVAAAGANVEGATSTNDALKKLAAMRVARMKLTRSLRRSKVAWKFAMLRQGLTYRLVDLAEGAIREWNESRYLSAMILARACLETGALLHSIVTRMRAALDKRDLTGLNDLAETEMIGSRLQKWIDEDGYKSTNVLTAIDHLDKQLDGARDFYEQISEAAHPNGRGTVQFYAKADRATAEVDFSPRMHSPDHMFDMVQGAMIVIEWSLRQLPRMDAMVEDVSQLQVDLGDDIGDSH